MRKFQIGDLVYCMGKPDIHGIVKHVGYSAGIIEWLDLDEYSGIHTLPKSSYALLNTLDWVVI